MYCYLEGLKPGTELDANLSAKSHRKIGVNE